MEIKIKKIEFESNTQVYEWEQKIYEDIIELVKQLKQEHQNINFVILKKYYQRKSITQEKYNTEKLEKYWTSVDIYLARNRKILEHRKGEGMWTGAFYTIIKVAGVFHKKLHIHENYREAILEDLEYAIEEYNLDSQSHYEDVELTKEELKNADEIVWID